MGYFIYIQTGLGTQKVPNEFPTFEDAEVYMTKLLQREDVIVRDYEIIKNPDDIQPKFKMVAPWKTNRRWNVWHGKYED
jgi:hypothetical protein